MDAFLQVLSGPIWKSLKESQHSFSQAIINLFLDVEAKHQAIMMVQDSAVARADFQELGAKFEAKIQENAQRVGQLQRMWRIDGMLGTLPCTSPSLRARPMWTPH